jgi:SAM-dependent methyltransferase
MRDRGAVTPDGCPVEVYLRLPAGGEPDLIHGSIPPNSRLLELGCGTGRLVNPLVDRGHRVTGVDESPAMLAHVRGVIPVLARIEDLQLGETFDAVLLAGNLISTVPAARRHQFLVTCRRHLAVDGILIVQWLPPTWFDDLRRAGQRSADLGPVRGHLRLVPTSPPTPTAEPTTEPDLSAAPLAEPGLPAEPRAEPGLPAEPLAGLGLPAESLAGAGLTAASLAEPGLPAEPLAGSGKPTGELLAGPGASVVEPDVGPDVLAAETVYEWGGRRWVQRFEAFRRTEAELRADLSRAGLTFGRWLDDARTWFTAG